MERVRWCWSCKGMTVQKEIEEIYSSLTFRVVRFECLKCKNHNVTIINKEISNETKKG